MTTGLHWRCCDTRRPASSPAAESVRLLLEENCAARNLLGARHGNYRCAESYRAGGTRTQSNSELAMGCCFWPLLKYLSLWFLSWSILSGTCRWRRPFCDFAARLLFRHDDDFFLWNGVECVLINTEVGQNQIGWRVAKPFRERQVLVNVALEHFQKF